MAGVARGTRATGRPDIWAQVNTMRMGRNTPKGRSGNDLCLHLPLCFFLSFVLMANGRPVPRRI